MEKPGEPQSLGSQSVGRDWSELAKTHTEEVKNISTYKLAEGGLEQLYSQPSRLIYLFIY